MANPWLIGLGALAIGVVGMMLIGGKSTTAAPDRMPTLNSAIRGKPVSVTFGTNKVSPQITWTNNYQADPQNGGKKGKSGGSGGMGSAKGGNSGSGYIYKWDMMFQFGIMDVPSIMIRGWLGSDRIDDRIMSDITAGGNLAWQAIIKLADADPAAKTATLQYDESFLGQAFNTGDANLVSWPYFDSVIGDGPMSFPSNAWVGFRQLVLGQTPAVPQLSFEFGPADVSLDFSSTGKFISAMDTPSNQSNCYMSPFVKDTAGNFYNVLQSTSGVTAWRLDTGVANSISFAAQTTNIQTIPEFAAITLGAGIPLAIDGSEFFYIYSNQLAGANGYMIQCYRIETDGSFTFMNAAQYQEDFSLGGNCGETVFATGMTINGEMIIVTNANTFVSSNPGHLLVVHDLSFFKTTLIQPVFNAACGGRHMTTTFGGFDLLSDPFWNGKVGLVNDASQMVIYYGPTDMDAPPAGSYAASQAAFFPDGLLVVADLFSDNAGTLTWTLIGPDNGFMRDQTGAIVVPYSDVDHSGSGDYGAPQQYGRLVTVSRGYSSDHFKAGIRAGIFDPGTNRIILSSTAIAGDYFTSTDHSAPDPPAFMHAQLAGTELVVTARVSSGFGNYVNGTFGAQLPGGSDVTPAYVIYRILTSEIFGFATNAAFGYSITVDRVDTASYLLAHEWCVAQGIFISVTYDTQQNVLDILKELLDLYNGFLVVDGGIIRFGFVDGTVNPVRVIDNNHLVPTDAGRPPVNTAKGSIDDAFNIVQFNYLDRTIDYDQNQVQVDDPVDQDINGPRIKTYDTKFVMAGSVANMIALRALWANLYGTDTYDFQLGWKDADLQVGDQITLIDSFDPLLKFGVTARLTKWSPQRRGVFAVSARREYTYIAQASGDFTQATSMDAGFSSLVDSIQPMQMQTAYELPREFQGSKAQVYFGYAQASRVMGAKFYFSTGGSYVEAADVTPFITSGRLAQSLTARPKGHVENDLEFYIFTSSFGSSITFVQTFAMPDVDTAMRATGGGILICGSEAISVENLTLLGQNHYRAKYGYRGWGGSPIAAHNSGDFFHKHGTGTFALEITPDKIGTSFSYKIAGYNFAGQVYDVSSIAARSYTIKGDYWLPREQPHTRMWIDSAVSWPNSQYFKGQYVGVLSGGCNVNLTWSLADNVEGYGAGGYGAGTYGHFIMADSVSWRIDISSKNGTKVSSFFVNTNAFTYNRAQNSADFTGFGHDLIYTVTPYNNYGDGPVNDVRSLSLNW